MHVYILDSVSFVVSEKKTFEQFPMYKYIGSNVNIIFPVAEILDFLLPLKQPFWREREPSNKYSSTVLNIL